MRAFFLPGLLGLILIACLFTAPLRAAETRSLFQVGVDSMLFGYQEFDNQGALLDEEHGFIPGLLLAYTANWPNWYVDVSVRLQGGIVEYDGMTQSFDPVYDGLPITSRTDTFISETVLLFGRKFLHKQHSETAIYGGVGYHYWFRGIRASETADGTPVSGLDENYQWFYALFGGKYTFAQTRNMSFGVDLQARYPFMATMEVAPPGYDTVTLYLGREWSGRISLPLAWYFNAKTRLIVEPYYETWDMGASDDVELTVSGAADPFGQAVLEPRSETRNYGLWLKIGFYY